MAAAGRPRQGVLDGSDEASGRGCSGGRCGGGVGLEPADAGAVTTTVTVSGSMAATVTPDGITGTTVTSCVPGVEVRDVDADDDRRRGELVEVRDGPEQREQHALVAQLRTGGPDRARRAGDPP